MTLAEAGANPQRVVIHQPPGRPDEYGSIAGVDGAEVLVRFEGCVIASKTRPEHLTLVSRLGQ